jgi:hypothetical protein
MGVAYLSVGAFVAVFAACILWASRCQPLSEWPHEDEMSAGPTSHHP